MGGDTGLLNPGDLVGGNIADDEASVLLCLSAVMHIHQVCRARMRHNGYLHGGHPSSRHVTVTDTRETAVVVCYRVLVGVGCGHSRRKR